MLFLTAHFLNINLTYFRDRFSAWAAEKLLDNACGATVSIESDVAARRRGENERNCLC